MISTFKHMLAGAVVVSVLLASFLSSSYAESINYVYDNLNRLKSIEYGNGTMIVYQYDAVGNRVSTTAELDSDGDGMPDVWELLYGLNPYYSADAGYDKDGDGLTNLEEYQWGTDPTNPDTDGDGMSDRWEVINNLDPLINDASGDNDNDGLTNLTEYQYGANPNNIDTDGDQMPDQWEVLFGLNSNLNDAAFDNDSDGSSNLQEYQAGTHPTANIETVDSSGNVGNYNSIAVDTNNNVHISYYDATATKLKYATNTSGGWVPTPLTSANQGQYSSIAVDQSNNVHISFSRMYDVTNSYYRLRYATNASGSWVAANVDTSVANAGTHTSIAVDSNNDVHVSYYDATNANLKYATKVSGVWGLKKVDATGSVGKFTSIAVDSNNNEHISYYDATNTSLKYATKVSGVWGTLETVDSTGDVGKYTSIAADSNNNVHISYYDVTNAHLKYATKVNGVWAAPETVDSTGSVGAYTSIAVDSKNKVHIVYYDATHTSLKYATNMSGSWVTAIVAASVSAGYTSIAIDSNDKMHISYYDGTLKYATTSVNNPPTADAGGTYTATEGQAMNLNASASTGTIVKYEWDVNNDGIYEYSSSSSATQNHIYAQQGTYTIKLRVTDNLGTTATATTTATISDTTPSANFTASPTSGPAPLQVNFSNSSTGYDQPLSYAWDFDNDGTDDSPATNPSAIFTGQGTYTVKLTVTDSNGDATTLINPNYITVTPPGYTLTINKTGNGSGTVTSSPAGIDCGADCAETYSVVTAVTLTALPNAGSKFTGWSGGGCSGTGNCALTVNSNTTVTATFDTCSNLPVRIMRNGVPVNSYSSLQAAYADAISGDIIQSQAALFTENLNAGDINNKSITIEGGYDCGYTAVTGKTALKGQAIISKGTNRVKNFVFKK